MKTMIYFILIGLVAGMVECFLIYAAKAKQKIYKSKIYLDIFNMVETAFNRKTPIRKVYVFNLAVIMMTAVIFALFNAHYYYMADKISACLIISYMTVVFFITLSLRKIPNSLFIFGLVLGIACAMISLKSGIQIYIDKSMWNPFIGAAIGFGVLAVTAFISAYLNNAGNVSFGDMKLLCIIGIMLGWRLLIITMIFSFAAISVLGIFLFIFRLRGKANLMNYAPMAAATVLPVLFIGELLFRYYSGTLL